MALNKEIWESAIVEGLFADNSFLARALNHSPFANFKTVHVPNAGSAPAVTKNRSEYPAQAGNRQDYDLTYNLNEFTTEPIHITNIEEVELSYDKRSSILGATQAALKEAVAKDVLKAWVPSGYTLVKTTGDAVAHHLPSQTGNRKKLTLADIVAVKKEFDKANLPQDGRCFLLDYEMYSELLDALSAVQSNAFLASADTARGIVGKLYGFDFYMRSEVLRTVAAGTSLSSGTNATDQAAGIAWSDKFVSVAQGAVEIFAAEKDPTYYGDIISALVRAGGSFMRYDKKGVVILAQDTAA